MATKNKNKIMEVLSTLVDEENNDDTSENSADNISCNPQSRDSFLERVKTFTSTNWAAKPFELSPLLCARYGWCNDHPDQLRCVTCNAKIYAGIPDDWDSSAYAEICTKLQNELQIGHEKLCPWPHNPCPPSFLSLPAHSVEQWKQIVKVAFDNLVELRSYLPELNEDEIASMKVLNNSCIEDLLSNIFKYGGDHDGEALQGKVACILAVTGWTASMPIVEDPSLTCTTCGIEVGLWNYKSLSHRSQQKRHKHVAESIGAISQQSLGDYPDVMSSSVSVKSEKSENSAHSGSMTHELSKLATSSDSLAQSDLLKPAGSQESLINLRVSDSKNMVVDSIDNQEVDHLNQDDNKHQYKSLFSEPRLPHATPPELMKELLLSTAPGSGRSHSIYSDSIFSEVGSECFEKRLEETNDRDIEYDKAISENPPTSHPNHVQQQWMKELLFMTAETKSPSINESLISEIGSVSFDRRLDNSSVINSPRSMTPVHRVDCLDDGEPVRTKRMRFQEPDILSFSILEEHRHWCPWIAYARADDFDVTITDGHNSSPNMQKIMPGWKIVLFNLLPSVRNELKKISTPPPAEAWRTVRNVLGDCVSTSPSK